jgi:NHLM bacteriocin system ABC transporter ATP-binding protein
VDRTTASEAPERITVEGNAPVALDDPGFAWVVETGALALFGIAYVSGEPAGSRRYLLTIETGQAAFGMTPDDEITGLGLVGVAIERTVLMRLPVAELRTMLDGGDSRGIAWLETWITHIASALGGLRPERAPAGSLWQTRPGTKRYDLAAGDVLAVAQDEVRWFQILAGSARWMGLGMDVLSPEVGIVPMGPGMWVIAEEPVQLVAVTFSELWDLDFMLAGLAALPARFLSAVATLEGREAEADVQRYHEQVVLEEARSAEVLDELAALLGSRRKLSFHEGEPLLGAARLVGERLGIAIKAPPRSEDGAGRQDPVDAIARASNVRVRAVSLDGRWWTRDCGPLLAFAGDAGRPVALLPARSKRYDLVDPADGAVKGIDDGLAATLAQHAYMFYRPFPPGPVGLWTLARFGVRGRGRDSFHLVLAGMTAALLGLLAPVAMGVMIDQAVPGADLGLLLQVAAALIAAAVGSAFFQLCQGIVSTRIATLAEGALDAAVWDRVLQLGPPFFRQFPAGDLQSRVGGITRLGNELSGATLRTLFGGLFGLVNLAVMIAYSASLALVAALLALVAVALTCAHGTVKVSLGRRLQQVEGELFGLGVQLVGGVAKLRVAEAESGAFAHWARRYATRQGLADRIRGVEDSLEVSNEILGAIGTPVLFWCAVTVAGLQVDGVAGAVAGGAAGGLSAGTFLAFNAAFGAFLASALAVGDTTVELLDLANIWERVKPVLETPVEVETGRADPGRLAGRIAVDRVTFRYRPDGPAILDDVSLTVEPGESIALVGPSGSGKSTLFRLLLGFETPEAGAVLFDGQELARVDVRAVRRQIGTVLQNARPQAGTLAGNIAGGAQLDQEALWEAARGAGLAEDIAGLPMGMHTMLSEGGSNLSGGQRQRLMIARALAQKPAIVLFDEATSALDNVTQAIVVESLSRLEVTRVVIAHRLSTVRHCDRIYVLDRGRVVQEGSYEQLAEEEGLFARLIARQLA